MPYDDDNFEDWLVTFEMDLMYEEKMYGDYPEFIEIEEGYCTDNSDFYPLQGDIKGFIAKYDDKKYYLDYLLAL